MPQYFGHLPGLDPSWTSLGNCQTFRVDKHGVELDCTGGPRLRLGVLLPNLLHIRLAPTGDFAPHRSWSVTKADQVWEPVPFQVEEHPQALTLKTAALTLRIDLTPCRITYFDPQGRSFAEDTELGMGWSAEGVSAWKAIAADEHFYGCGERTGLLDKLAERKTNWTTDAIDYDSLTDAMYTAIPFFIALRPGLSYGIFLNATGWSQFDLGASQPGVWQMHSRASELDYYLIYGPQPAQILETYTALTGRMPLPPKWSLGYHQCRWSYESETIVRQLAQEFRQRQIPCDVIHLDIDYMQGYRVFTWHQQRFANPKGLISDLAAQGFRVVTIVDPGVKYEPEANYPVFDQGLVQDYFMRHAHGTLFHGYVWPDKAVFPDFLRPEVRQWWGEQHQILTDAGVSGIWNDMNEPTLDDRPFGDGGHKISFPLDAPQGPAAERTTHSEVHNLYGQSMAQAASEAMTRLRPQERPFILSRSGFAGIQRWSSVWMGDNQSLWEHLEFSLPMLCNMGLSGVPFVGCDIGGFAGNATGELFARWMQVGMLYPLMRGHSALSTGQHEPWCFGDRVEAICREYIQLRYRLLPYLYSLFWLASTTGAPILRPLVYHYPDDPRTYSLHDQVLLGPFLMAAPVYRPGVEYRAVYLPEGIWYDWWTQKRFVGPSHILAHAPLERMPLYLRQGAIVPMQPLVQCMNEQPFPSLTLKITPGEGEWTLYEDDGHSFAYQRGQWATTTYRLTQAGNTVTLAMTSSSPAESIGDQQAAWTPPQRDLQVELVGNGQLEIQY